MLLYRDKAYYNSTKLDTSYSQFFNQNILLHSKICGLNSAHVTYANLPSHNVVTYLPTHPAAMGEQDTSNQGYTASQVDSYLSRISFPVKQWPKIIAADARSDAGLAYLTKLMKYQISTVPFENLSLHYSKFPGLSLDKEDLFEKIVVKRRGGYCMELNYLFATVLKTLGYEVVHAGARVYDVHITSPPWGEPGGWCAILVVSVISIL